MRLAIVTDPIPALAHTGRGCTLPVGAYRVVDIDGAGPNLVYVHGPNNGDLVAFDPTFDGVTIANAGDPYHNSALPPDLFAGFVIGECGHRVAGSEFRAGMRTCERCPA